MPTDELRRFEPVSDAVVLAAIERGECHCQSEGPWWIRVVEHLNFVRNGWPTWKSIGGSTKPEETRATPLRSQRPACSQTLQPVEKTCGR